MNDVWINNPKILFENIDQFFPTNNMKRNERINAIARLAIYYSLIILIFKKDMRLLSVGIIMILISLFLGYTEEFTINNESNVFTSDHYNNIEGRDKSKFSMQCTKPTINNPFMNYTMGDLIDNKERLPACKYDDSKNAIRGKFRSNLHSDVSDIWGRFITDRNFYTMPNTDIVNDQTGFAQWCFGNSGECKTVGTNCLKQRDPNYHRGRVTDFNDEY